MRGLGKNTSADLLRVNLRVLSTNPEGDVALHVDTLELNASRQRMAFIKQAAEELTSGKKSCAVMWAGCC